MLIAGLILYLIQMLPLPPPFKTVALVLFVVVIIIWLLGGGPGIRIS